MEENKTTKPRRAATKKRIEEFRTTNPSLTDERMVELVESTYPDRYLSEVGLEVVKEMYRNEKELNETNFTRTLKKLHKDKKINKYDKKILAVLGALTKERDFLYKIYKDANERTVSLFDYPEYDESMRDFFEKSARDKEVALSTYLSSQLNVIAMYETSDDDHVTRNYLQFKCYGQSDGNVIFTKGSRPSGVSKAAGGSGSGCMVVLMAFIVLAVSLILVS